MDTIGKEDNADWEIAKTFRRTTGAQFIPIHFVGVWDTVSSVLVPTNSFPYIGPKTMPFTLGNDLVRTWRHAVAIDERRVMFHHDYVARRKFKPVPWVPDDRAEEQDIEEVWFAGVHSDIGGGLAEKDSQLAKYPLLWITREAQKHGLKCSDTRIDRYVLGKANGAQGTKGRTKMAYVAPSTHPAPYRNMTFLWTVLEFFPMPVRRRITGKKGLFGLFTNRMARRRMGEHPKIHHSAVTKFEEDTAYAPSNWPQSGQFTVVKDELAKDPEAP